MKDYLLSEMLKICKTYDDDCAGCPFETICQNGIVSVNKGDIEPRDMIELPCKLKYIKINPDREKYFIGSEAWKVIYMAKYDGQIYDESFDEEAEADEFLQELKNGKV